MSVKLVIGTAQKPVRFSYVTLKEPKQFNGQGKFNYSLQVLVPKSDTKAIAAINKAIEDAIAEGVASKKFNQAATKNPKFWIPFRDGDQKAEEAEKTGSQDYLKGHMFFTPKNERRPGVVDDNLQPILDLDEVYSGCYGMVAVNFSPYSTQGGIGIGVYVNHVMKVEDGERLDGTESAESAFAGMVEAPASEGGELQ